VYQQGMSHSQRTQPVPLTRMHLPEVAP